MAVMTSDLLIYPSSSASYLSKSVVAVGMDVLVAVGVGGGGGVRVGVGIGVAAGSAGRCVKP